MYRGSNGAIDEAEDPSTGELEKVLFIIIYKHHYNRFNGTQCIYIYVLLGSSSLKFVSKLSNRGLAKHKATKA